MSNEFLTGQQVVDRFAAAVEKGAYIGIYDASNPAAESDAASEWHQIGIDVVNPFQLTDEKITEAAAVMQEAIEKRIGAPIRGNPHKPPHPKVQYLEFGNLFMPRNSGHEWPKSTAWKTNKLIPARLAVMNLVSQPYMLGRLDILFRHIVHKKQAEDVESEAA